MVFWNPPQNPIMGWLKNKKACQNSNWIQNPDCILHPKLCLIKIKVGTKKTVKLYLTAFSIFNFTKPQDFREFEIDITKKQINYFTFFPKAMVKRVQKGVQLKRPNAVQSALIRRHFLELTQTFMIPLGNIEIQCYLPIHDLQIHYPRRFTVSYLFHVNF